MKKISFRDCDDEIKLSATGFEPVTVPIEIGNLYIVLNLKQKNSTINCEVSVSATGFEPVTVCLEGRCSIQLSYAP